jgi:hypothetical protein
MERRTIIRALLACTLLTAAACAGDPLAPQSEAPDSNNPPTTCRTPAPEPGMTCRGEVWSWS